MKKINLGKVFWNARDCPRFLGIIGESHGKGHSLLFVFKSTHMTFPYISQSNIVTGTKKVLSHLHPQTRLSRYIDIDRYGGL